MLAAFLFAMQVATCKREAASQQHEYAQERAALARRAAAAEAAAAAAAQQAEELGQRRVQEMDGLQARFAALLRTKDDTIGALSRQLEELHAAV